MKYQAVLIDLDGTLIDTVPDLTDAANAMREDLGMAVLSNEVIGTYIGKGFASMMARVLGHDLVSTNGGTPKLADLDQLELDPILVSRGRASFRRHYHRLSGNKARLYAGVVEGLDEFKNMSLKLAVVTNKSTEFTPPLLEKMGILQYFDVIVCGDTCATKKPDPAPLLHACDLLGVEPQKALFIGDSVNDVMAALAVEMDMLVLPYGYNEGEPVQNLPASDIVDSILFAAIWAKQQKD